MFSEYCSLSFLETEKIMEYYGNCLSQTEKKLYLKMTDALCRRLSSVRIEQNYDEKSFLNCIHAIQYDYPELFHVDFDHFRWIDYGDNVEYFLQYLYDEKDTLRKQKLIRERVCRIIEDLNKKGISSIYQRCGYIHSYFVKNCTYNEEAVENPDKEKTAYTIEGPLLEGTGVCLGIALAYRMVCRKCRIDAIVVVGSSFRPGTVTYTGHAWDMIRAGKCAVHVDVTWDMCLTADGEPVRYDYFFLSDMDMLRDHQYIGYPVCREMRINYFERTGTQFEKLEEMDSFIKRVICGDKKRGRPGTYFFQFKISDRKKTKGEVQEYVKKIIGKYTNRGWQGKVTLNGSQSVFSYKIEIK